jgi:hypothetical protein
MLLTKNNEELNGIGPLLGIGLRAWKTVLLEPNWPYYLVRFSTKTGEDDWTVNAFLVANEIDLAGFCYSVQTNNAQRIEEITQIMTRGSNAQQYWELSKIAEIWEGEVPLEHETGGTTILLMDSNGKSIGSDPRSLGQIRIRSKCFPTNG